MVSPEKALFIGVHCITRGSIIRGQLYNSLHKLLGIRSRGYSADEETRLKGLGADFHRTNRGGLITFHGPGQLVLYPILDLTSFSGRMPSRARKKSVLGVKWYIHTLEQTVIDSLAEFGVIGIRSPHTGVWVDQEAKICAMGVANTDLVTSHGLALNCDVDLEWFEKIVACGLEGKRVTSLSQQLNRKVAIEDVEQSLLNSFERNFGCKIV